MKSWIKIVIVILCLVVLGAIFYLLGDMKKKVDQKNENKNSNTTNTTVSNTAVTPTPKLTPTPAATATPEPTPEPTPDNKSEEADVGSFEDDEKNKNEAIKLAKEKWGDSDDSVYFTNEGKNDDGEYLVSVRSKSTTYVEVTFKVNLETKKVKADI